MEKHALNEKMDPVNPWLAEAVKEVRVKYTDNYLRVRYVSFLDDCPEKDWTGFLEELALYNKTRDNDFLLTKRKDFGVHLQSSVGDYPKIVLRRYMKKGRSDTPLS